MSRRDGGPEQAPARRDLLAFAAWVLLVLLALLLPFEAPVCRVGPLQLTTDEIALYAVLSAWGLVLARDLVRAPRDVWLEAKRALREPLVVATLAWTAVVFLSAAVAENRPLAVKFALRSLSGILLFFAARRLTRRNKLARPVLVAVLVGALASALSALVESFFPTSFSFWGHFRDNNFETFGLRRASGVFGYPTIGAMYWEASLPLLAVVWIGPLRARATVAMGGVILSGAIVASATRSSLAGGAVTTVLLFLGTRRWEGRGSGSAFVVATTLFVTSAVAVGLPGAGSLLGQRLRFWHDDTWFGVTYESPSSAESVATDEVFTTHVTLHNTGTVAWPHQGPQPTRLSYHWYQIEDGTIPPAPAAAIAPPPTLATFEGRRTMLPVDVAPGETVSVEAVAEAPSAPGTYRLAWDLVQESVTWFSARGNPTASLEVRVLPRTDAARPPLAPPVWDEVAPPPPRPSLWRAAVTLFREHPWLGIGPDQFRFRYEPILSPAPNGEPYKDTRIHANSFYFETLADMGILGMVALCAVVAGLAVTLRRQARDKDLLRLGLCVGAASFFVHGASDYFLEFTPGFGLYWLLLGLAGASPAAPRAQGGT